MVSSTRYVRLRPMIVGLLSHEWESGEIGQSSEMLQSSLIDSRW